VTLKKFVSNLVIMHFSRNTGARLFQTWPGVAYDALCNVVSVVKE